MIGGYCLVMMLRLLIVVASVAVLHGLYGACASAVAAYGFPSCGSQALEHRFISFGARALLLYDIWDLPHSGIEPASSALVGRFFTTERQGKPWKQNFKSAGM